MIVEPTLFRTELWLTPLILLPGVALLVVSTSNRFAQVDKEFHDLIDHPAADTKVPSRHLLRRCRMLRDALMALYLSVMLFAAASLIGGVLNLWLPNILWVVGAAALLGILALLVAAVQLVRESRLVMQVILDHERRLREPES